MKRFVTLLLFIAVHQMIMAQNVGIGSIDPMNKMHIVGNLLVNTPTKSTSTPPTAAQTKTMPGLGILTFLLNTDSTGRLYDPGGPGGNYGIDLDSKATIASSIICVAMEVTAETMDLHTGDSLIIKESSTGATLLAIGNGFNSTGKWIFNSSSLYVNFKSNTDFNTGAGFSLLFRRLYDGSPSLPNISGAAGTTFFFDVKKGSLRSGDLNNSVTGINSTAMGYRTTASGLSSVAMGWQTEASAFSSTAMGYYTNASANYSTAMGYYSAASGENSIAMGQSTNASGDNSTAMGRFTGATGSSSTAIGRNTTASGDNSTAMGNYVSTNNQDGSFVLGDNSTTTIMNSANPNNFRARFAGGYKLFTSSNLATGCTLFAGDNAWTTGSDVHSKENFAAINGEDFLKKISRFNLTSWNYKTQNPKTFRHYGPMAQDFYAAFGKDEYGTIGNDTTINSADFAGVSFIAIQALEKRTTEYKNENEELKAMILQLRKEVDELKKLK